MLISRSRRFVFVHVPKTAGTSVMRVLLPHARWRDRVAFGGGRATQVLKFANRRLGLQDRGMSHVTGYHKFTPAREAAERMGERWSRYFSFAFVRNPYDWIVSVHAHLRRIPGHPLHEAAVKHEFADFLAWAEEHGTERQVDYVTDAGGRVLVDRLGRLESLDRDFPAICREIGVSCGALPRANANPQRPRDYRGQFDDDSRERATRLFAEDLSLFGYDFEGTTASE